MKMKEWIKQAVQMASVTAVIAMLTPTASATNKLMEQTWVTGGIQLIKDATAVSMIVFPLLGILEAGYFWWRRSTAEPQEKAQWRDKTINAASVGIVIGLISGIVSVVTSYLA